MRNLAALLDGDKLEKPDAAASLQWLEKASQAGDMTARAGLGRAYALGEGLPKQPEQARPLLAKAAAEGHEAAKSLLQSL